MRALGFSMVCVTLSAAGHTMASGVRVQPRALLASGAGVTVMVAPSAGGWGIDFKGSEGISHLG